MFELFGVQTRIHYGTFRKQCEIFVNKNVDIREEVEKLISTPPLPSSARSAAPRVRSTPPVSSPPKRVLLIDEVDAFLNPATYGKQYNIFTRIPLPGKGKKIDEDYPEIDALIRFVWDLENKSSPAFPDTPGFRGQAKPNDILARLFRAVMESDVYRDFKRRYSHCEDLMIEVIKTMISDLESYENHAVYEVRDGRVLYKEGDGQSDQIIHGHKVSYCFSFYCRKTIFLWFFCFFPFIKCLLFCIFLLDNVSVLFLERRQNFGR